MINDNNIMLIMLYNERNVVFEDYYPCRDLRCLFICDENYFFSNDIIKT